MADLDVALVTSCENSVDQQANDEDNDEKPKESLRIQIGNLPKHCSFLELKKILKKNLDKIEYRKLKIFENVGYVSFGNQEDKAEATKKLNEIVVKGNALSVKSVVDDPHLERKPRSPKPIKTAVEITTPLAGLAYNKQLEMKMETSKKVAISLKKQFLKAGVPGVHRMRVEDWIMSILPSPVQTNYRNKTELTVGYTEDGAICSGFVATKLQDRKLITVPIYECSQIPTHAKEVNRTFEKFITDSGLPPFNEFERHGCWKSILIRDFLSDCMVVITVFPFGDADLFEKTKKDIIRTFTETSYNEIGTKPIRVTSLWIAVQQHSSDEPKVEKLAGAPFVYERLNRIKYRISPNTFFQTNTHATSVLYDAIGDALGFPSDAPRLFAAQALGEKYLTQFPVEKTDVVASEMQDATEAGVIESVCAADDQPGEPSQESTVVTNEPMAKKTRLADASSLVAEGESLPKETQIELPVQELTATDPQGDQVLEGKEPTGEDEDFFFETEELALPENEEPALSRTLILDICCGAGTIGIMLMKRLLTAKKRKTFNGAAGVLGIEIVKDAIADAHNNVKDNGLDEENFRYVAGPAETIFTSLDFFIPISIKKALSRAGKDVLEPGEVYGILDPPRAGMCTSVIVGCRKLTQMRTLVYVSCDPSAATKNIVDLCRPSSNKFEGEPFKIDSIHPVDMFPGTIHFEWVIRLVR